MEPQWVEKVEQGKEKEIKTTINPNDQALLTMCQIHSGNS